ISSKRTARGKLLENKIINSPLNPKYESATHSNAPQASNAATTAARARRIHRQIESELTLLIDSDSARNSARIISTKVSPRNLAARLPCRKMAHIWPTPARARVCSNSQDGTHICARVARVMATDSPRLDAQLRQASTDLSSSPHTHSFVSNQNGVRRPAAPALAPSQVRKSPRRPLVRSRRRHHALSQSHIHIFLRHAPKSNLLHAPAAPEFR